MSAEYIGLPTKCPDCGCKTAIGGAEVGYDLACPQCKRVFPSAPPAAAGDRRMEQFMPKRLAELPIVTPLPGELSDTKQVGFGRVPQEAIQIGGSLVKAWFIWSFFFYCFIFGGLAVQGLISLLETLVAGEKPSALVPGLIIILGSLAFLSLAYPWYQSMRKREQWLVITPTGFTKYDRTGQVEFRDEDVTVLQLLRPEPITAVTTMDIEDPHYTGPMIVGWRGRCTLWIKDAQGEHRLDLHPDYQPEETNPVKPLLDRLRQRLFAQASERLASGQAVTGPDWQLTAKELCWDHGAKQLPLSDIEEVGCGSDLLQVWRTGEIQPAVKIPFAAPSTWLLHELLCARLPETPPSIPGEWGRVVFERRHFYATVATILFLWVGLLLLLGMAALFGSVGAWIVCGSLTLLPVWGLVKLSRARFICYQRGIMSCSAFGTQVLSFHDLATTECKKLNTWWERAAWEMRFRPLRPEQGAEIVLLVSGPWDDPDLVRLREHIDACQQQRHLGENRDCTLSQRRDYQID